MTDHPRLHAPPRSLVLTRAEVRALDRQAIDELGIPGIVLMENAAAAIEEVIVRERLAPIGASILIVCGPGNNGGDGLALAHRLHHRGHRDITVALARAPKSYSGDASINLRIAQRLNMRIISTAEITTIPTPPALVIDALFGTGLDRPLAGVDAEAVRTMNEMRRHGAAILAVDLPSGMDADTGRPLGPGMVEADLTVTLAALKPGLLHPAGASAAGRVFVGDIGLLPPM